MGCVELRQTVWGGRDWAGKRLGVKERTGGKKQTAALLREGSEPIWLLTEVVKLAHRNQRAV